MDFQKFAFLAVFLISTTSAQWQITPHGFPLTFSPFHQPTVTPVATSSQFHAQDELGQASFGYAHPGQSSVTHRDASGNQVGSYEYINPEGKLVRVDFVADALGFRVASNALPVAPSVPAAVLPVGPAPVEDTPEVKQARAEHMAAIAEAKSRSRRSLVAMPFSLPTLVHAPLPATALPLSLPWATPLTHVPALVALAAPVAPVATVAGLPASSSSKYHVQTELGEAQFGHAGDDQAHAAVRDFLGNVHGSYGYVNHEGRVVNVQYSNGINGFLGATRWSIN